MANSINKKGILLPPAVGYSLKIIVKLFTSNHVPFKYYPRSIIISIINLINWPFRNYEKKVINPGFTDKPITENPVFIIGHWRSGTTHLHNLLCQDPQMGYVTTFQSVFPDTLFNKAGRFLFENFTRILIPGRRKGDNVILGTSKPQEEEFALGDKTPICYYYFWMFPQRIMEYYNYALRLNGVESRDIESWKADYKLLIKKALKNTKRKRFLSKNPPNTARIKVLLEMFPKAKFIHIHRNPVEVFLSTRHFFENMMPHLQLQKIEKEVLDQAIFHIYKNLMNDYYEQKILVPHGNLIEISFDELEDHPEEIVKEIYEGLKLEGFEDAKPGFDKYFKQTKSYKKNKHMISKSQLQKILQEWDFAMKRYNYSVPENIEIVED
jgi:hypothetical protein